LKLLLTPLLVGPSVGLLLLATPFLLLAALLVKALLVLFRQPPLL
jgi:hypothetical protein